MTRQAVTLRGASLLGSLRDMRKDRARFFVDIARSHGDAIRTRRGLIPLLIVSAPDLAHEMLVEKTESFAKG